MARVLIVGASGYVGTFLLGLLRRKALEVLPTFFRHPTTQGSDERFLDVRDPKGVQALLREFRPHVIFHLAYDMEDLDGSVVRGTRNLLDAWTSTGRQGRFFYMSTDMVFDGENPPYQETDLPRPVIPYGEAKLKAELMALEAGAHVLRSSLVYGLSPMDPRTESLRLGLIRGVFHYPYFEDEMRSAIALEDLCFAMAQLAFAEGPIPPIVHLAGPESLSRYCLACLLAEAMGFDPGPIPRARLGDTLMPRPRDLTLEVSLAARLLGWSPRSAKEALSGKRPVS